MYNFPPRSGSKQSNEFGGPRGTSQQIMVQKLRAKNHESVTGTKSVFPYRSRFGEAGPHFQGIVVVRLKRKRVPTPGVLSTVIAPL
jgi:hypothetical protein